MTLLSELGWFRRRLDFWRREAPPHSGLPFDRAVLHFYRLTLWLAPSWLFIDAAKRFSKAGESLSEARRIQKEHENATAKYGICWLILLLAMWLLSPGDDLWAKVFAGIALFRLTEIGNTLLGFILDQREPLLGRSLVTVAFQAIQIALIFAITFHAFARHDFVVSSEAQVITTASTPYDFLYVSLTSMLTLGGRYTPETTLAQWLEVSTAVLGIVLLGIVAARAIGFIGKRAS